MKTPTTSLDDAPVETSRVLRVLDGGESEPERTGAQPPLLTADPVLAELEAALALRRAGADGRAMRRALRRVDELLDE